MRPYPIGPFLRLNPKFEKRTLQVSDMSVLENGIVYGGAVRMFPGWAEALGGYSTLNSPVLHINEHKDVDGNSFICIHTADSFYVWNGTILSNMTNTTADYDSGTTQWTSCSFGDLYIFANGIDNTQSWDSSTPGTEAVDLSNAPKCNIVRSFGSYVIAGCVQDGTPEGQKQVKWSAAGDPTNWTTLDSGSLYVYEAEGRIIAIEPLTRDSLTVYKEESVHTLSFVGYPLYFINVSMSVGIGVKSANGVARIGGYHICLTNNGLMIWDGSQPLPFQPIIKPLLDTLYPTPQASKSFCFYNPNTNNLWVGLPGDSGYCDTILVYKTDDDVWSMVSGATICSIGLGATSQARTWNSMTGSWDSQTARWSSSVAGLTDNIFLGTTSKVYKIDEANPLDTRDGATFTATLETGIIHPSSVLFEAPFYKSELTMIDILMSSGTPQVYVGVSETGAGTSELTWHGPYAPSSLGRINTTLVGRYFMFRIICTAAFELQQFIPYFVKRGLH